MGNRFSRTTPFTIEVLNLTLAKRKLPSRASIRKNFLKDRPAFKCNINVLNGNDDFRRNSPRLCELCRTEDLYSLLNERWITPKVPIFVELGRLQDIYNRAKDCYFCGFLAMSIHSTIALKGDAPHDEDDIALYAVKNIEDQERDYSQKTINVSPLFQALELRQARGLTKIVPFSDQPLHKFKDNSLPARVMAAVVNPNTLTSWLRRCHDSHHFCKPEEWREIPGLRLRLIDISRRQVVEPAEVPEYVALSYVWGTTEHFSLRYENYRILTQPGGLSGNDIDIPRVFSDAMELAEKLGFRYLWIDALCINQDDFNDKRIHIENMNRIYASAQLTIISGSESAFKGIPGVSPLSRPIEQTVYVCNGIALCNAKPDFEEAMSWSPWETRGWTFQENYFSKRRLILTESQAFYHCQRNLWAEDVVKDLSDPSNPKSAMWDSSPSAEKGTFKPSPSQDSHHQMSEMYYSLVDRYFPRELSYEKDSIHAFSGILDSCSKKLGAHIGGLPESIFHDALLWKSDFHSLTHRNREFPSWSWAGWMTGKGIHSHYEGIYQELGNFRSGLPWKEFRPKWFLLQQNETDPSMLDHVQIKCTIGGDSLRRLLPAHADNGLAMETFHHNGDCMPPISHILRSWVVSIFLHVDTKPCKENALNQRYEYTVRTRADGEGIGSIILDPKWRESRPDYLEFITLSARMPPLEYPLYLMLVEWDESGIAYRVQVCYLNLDRELTVQEKGSFGPLSVPVEDVDPVWKLISLA